MLFYVLNLHRSIVTDCIADILAQLGAISIQLGDMFARLGAILAKVGAIFQLCIVLQQFGRYLGSARFHLFCRAPQWSLSTAVVLHMLSSPTSLFIQSKRTWIEGWSDDTFSSVRKGTAKDHQHTCRYIVSTRIGSSVYYFTFPQYVGLTCVR